MSREDDFWNTRPSRASEFDDGWSDHDAPEDQAAAYRRWLAAERHRQQNEEQRQRARRGSR